MTHSMKIKTSPDEQVAGIHELHNVHICVCTSKRDTEYRIYTCSSPIEMGAVSKVNTKHIQSEYLAPELTVNLQQTSQKHMHAHVCVCVYV